METNNIINIPEGFEIDKDQSNDSQIENQRARTWEEYCKKMEGKDSYIAQVNGIVSSSQFLFVPYLTEFANKEDAIAFIAFDKLIKLRRDWIGDWKPDWTKTKYKFSIITKSNNVCQGINTTLSRSMSFPTAEMRDDFLDCFKELLEIAKPLL